MVRALGLIGIRHLGERPVRTGVTVLGIALGVAVSVAIHTANDEVSRSFQNAVSQVAGLATLQVLGGELGVDEEVITILRRHPSVIAATPVLHQAARVATGPHAGRAMVVMAFDMLEIAEIKDFNLSVGTGTELTLDPLLERNAVFLGEVLSAELGLAIGDNLDLLVGTTTYRLVLRGIIRANAGHRSTWGRMAVMDIAAAQALFGLVGRLDRIEIVTNPGHLLDKVAAELRSTLPQPMTIARPAQRNEQVEGLLRAMQVNLSTLGGVGLLIGFLLVYNTVAFAVVQRRREIGLFRALGMRRSTLMCLFLAEAGMLGLLGGVLGSALGIVLARGFVTLLSQSVSELYVSIAPSALETLKVLRRTDLWLQGCTLGIVVSMLGAIGPGLNGGRTAPARALAPGDYEAGLELRAGPLAKLGLLSLLLSAVLAFPGPVHGIPVWGYGSAFTLLLGLSCLAPMAVRALGFALRVRRLPERSSAMEIIGRIAVDQVSRAPGRNSVTVSALMVGLAVMIGVGIMIDSFRYTVEHWIHQTVLADLVVAPTGWLNGDDNGMLSKRLPLTWKDRLKNTSGVTAVDPYREVTVQVQGHSASLVSRDLALHAERSRYLFIDGDSRETLQRAIETEGVVVSEVLARRLGVARGHTLHIETPSGPTSFPVLGVFYDYATDGGKIVMDSAVYRRLWHDESTTVFALYLSTGTSLAEVQHQIAATLGREEHVAVIANAELRAEILSIFDRTFRVTYALELIAVVIALLGIINTLLTSVLERRQELATLRAIGASRGQITGLVLWEASWLGLLGSVLGVMGGIVLSILLIDVINKQSFGWTIQRVLPAGLFVQAVGLAVGAAAVAGYLPARWAAKQSVGDGLRYE